jgi:hypothetical protein
MEKITNPKVRYLKTEDCTRRGSVQIFLKERNLSQEILISNICRKTECPEVVVASDSPSMFRMTSSNRTTVFHLLPNSVFALVAILSCIILPLPSDSAARLTKTCGFGLATGFIVQWQFLITICSLALILTLDSSLYTH